MIQKVKNNNLKISVITPSYNSGKDIERAIKSVMEQDYKNFEHVIVDGGSTDGTIEILKKYKHLKWISESDKGQADAMNKGFKKSTGDIIVYLNADDYFFPGAFSSVIEEFKKGAEFVVGNVLVKSLRLGCEFINTPRITLEGMLRHWEPNAFSHNSLGYFYTRKVQKSCPFNSKNNITMDIEFLLDAASKFTFVKVENTLGCFEDGINTTTGKSQARLDYWQPDMFPYINKYLPLLSEVERTNFLKERRKGFALMQAHMNRLNEERFKLIPTPNIPLISVIIPTYNSAKYIERAVDSILAQGLKNLEVIIIDDASTDNTQDVLRSKYLNNHTVKIILHDKNKKQGESRNTGLNIAKGKYIFFLDSDDWIESKALSHLASIAEEYNVEIVACGINMVWENNKSEKYHAFAFSTKGGRDALNHFIDYRIGSIVWNKLYLREFIERNKLRFVDSYGKEDVIFTLQSVYVCKKYISINNYYCNYFQRSDSCLHSKQTLIHLSSYIQLYSDMIQFIEKIGICSDAEGEKICFDLLKSHCANDVYPRLVDYIQTRSSVVWENECLLACKKVLGVKGYALSSFIVEAMRDKTKYVALENKPINAFSLKRIIKNHFGSIIHGKFRQPLRKIYYTLRLNRFN